MQGKELIPVKNSVFSRITPAYAGKSIERRIISKQTKDHPRLCGEKAAGHRTRQGNLGSPPPMRGKVFMRVIDSDGEGITPAYAGKSYKYIKVTILMAGSPPPMRGKDPNMTRISFS